jgi:hypothetical protein
LEQFFGLYYYWDNIGVAKSWRVKYARYKLDISVEKVTEMGRFGNLHVNVWKLLKLKLRNGVEICGLAFIWLRIETIHRLFEEGKEYPKGNALPLSYRDQPVNAV